LTSRQFYPKGVSRELLQLFLQGPASSNASGMLQAVGDLMELIDRSVPRGPP
jgi:hypothetical protein